VSERTFRLSRAAEADLLELWAYILEESKSEKRADKVVADIVHKFATLADFQHMGRSRDEFGPEYRSFPINRHVVYYRLISEGNVRLPCHFAPGMLYSH
jgi:plasmid stabilization system protein ParE